MTSFQVLSSAAEVSFIGSRAFFHRQEKDFAIGAMRYRHCRQEASA